MSAQVIPISVRPPELRWQGGWIRLAQRRDSILTDRIHIAIWRDWLIRASPKDDPVYQFATVGRLPVGRGQLAISVRQEATDFRVSYKEMRLLIDRLIAEGRLRTEPISGAQVGRRSGAVGTLITICNYSAYQDLWAQHGRSMGEPVKVREQEGKKEGNKPESGTDSELPFDHPAPDTDSRPDGPADAGPSPADAGGLSGAGSGNRKRSAAKKPKPDRDAIDLEFEDWWAAWTIPGTKRAKGHALEAYRKARNRGADPDRLKSALRKHLRRWRDEETDLHYIPHPATWLNAMRWEDDLAPKREVWVGL